MLESWQTGVSTYALRQAALDAITAVGEILDATEAVLYQNVMQPDVNTVIGDVTVATFSGYAPSAALVFGTAYIAADGYVHVTAPSVQFTQTAITLTNTVQGWGITNGAGTLWIAGNNLPAPVTMDAIGKAIIVVPDIVYGQ